MSATFGILALLVLDACKHSPASVVPLRVAAAADLAEAFPEIGRAFERATGRPVTFSFGATGLLAKQIEEGAPFDVFAAANLSFVDEAIASGACEAETKTTYAEGRLVMWTKGDVAIQLATLGDLARPEIAHVAIANPEHAPYGKAAKEALQKSGVWDGIAKKIVYGENVQQALQFAQSGNADVAIVAQSLAAASGGHAVPIDPALHQPMKQGIVVCHGALEPDKALERDARKLVAFVGSDAGRAILQRYGFAVTPTASR